MPKNSRPIRWWTSDKKGAATKRKKFPLDKALKLRDVVTANGHHRWTLEEIGKKCGGVTAATVHYHLKRAARAAE